MSDRYDAFDEFMRQADEVIEFAEAGRSDVVVDAICLLAVCLACVPEDERHVCGLDDYYETVVAYAIDLMGGQEVAR